MTPDDIALLIEQRKWVPLAAIVIGLVVRLLKSDTKLPTVPPRARIWLVFGLGIVSGVLEHVVAGKTWTSAIVGGAVSAVLAIVGHESIIASLRGGKELVIPGLIIPGARPSPNAPPSIPPPGAAALLLALGFFLGCSPSRAQARGTVLATAEAVKIGDKLCADVALEQNDLPLARTCEQAYGDARSAVVAAAEGVDAWDEGQKGRVACAVQRAANGIAETVRALRGRRVSVPKVVDDALVLASSLGGCS